MLYYINDEIINKEQSKESRNCDHEIIQSNVLIDDTKYRYCKFCGMVAHEDNNFNYLCGAWYCRCSE